jgi:hypothetical protein
MMMRLLRWRWQLGKLSGLSVDQNWGVHKKIGQKPNIRGEQPNRLGPKTGEDQTKPWVTRREYLINYPE